MAKKTKKTTTEAIIETNGASALEAYETKRKEVLSMLTLPRATGAAKHDGEPIGRIARDEEDPDCFGWFGEGVLAGKESAGWMASAADAKDSFREAVVLHFCGAPPKAQRASTARPTVPSECDGVSRRKITLAVARLKPDARAALASQYDVEPSSRASVREICAMISAAICTKGGKLPEVVREALPQKREPSGEPRIGVRSLLFKVAEAGGTVKKLNNEIEKAGITSRIAREFAAWYAEPKMKSNAKSYVAWQGRDPENKRRIRFEDDKLVFEKYTG